MIFIALQFEHGVLRRALLALCDLQLVARFGKLTLGVLGGLGGKVELFGKAAAPRRQLAQLACAAQNACAARDRAARHRAAAVQNLAVERHNAERVRKPARDRDAAVKVLDHDRAAEQILENAVVFAVVFHQLARKADVAVLVLHARIAQRLAANRRERQERRASAVALL